MKDFEEVFLAHLEKLVSERHPRLQLEVPTSGWHTRGPRADFVVSNPVTGSALVGEVKSGSRARHLPFSMLPHLRALQAQVRSDHPARGEVVVITTRQLPALVLNGLTHDGIAILEVSSPEEAAERLGARLEKL